MCESGLDETLADHFPQHGCALGHEPAVTGLVAGGLAGVFVGQAHLAGDHCGLFMKRVDHAEFALGGAEVGAADFVGGRTKSHFAESLELAGEDLGAEIGNGAPGVEFRQLDIFLEGNEGHTVAPEG